MKTTIHLELEFEVDFGIQKEEKMTRHYPGCPASVEINEIKLIGLDGIYLASSVHNDLFDTLVALHGDEIEEVCWDCARDEEFEDAVAHAEHMRDSREDR